LIIQVVPTSGQTEWYYYQGEYESDITNIILNCFEAWQGETFDKYDVTGSILGNIQTYDEHDYELDPT
jgi:hypothetical protein